MSAHGGLSVMAGNIPRNSGKQEPTTAILSSQGPILSQLEERERLFSPAERRVVEQLLTSPDEFYQWTVTEVAQRAEVSDATVIRFAKDMGFSGFQSLKIALARERATLSRSVVEVESDDDWGRAMVHLQTHYAQMMQDTFARFDEATLRPIVEAISHARTVILLGVGTSGLAAQVLQYKLSRIGLATAFHPDTHYQALFAANAGPQDLVIAFSVSGSSRDTLEALTLAAEGGAPTVVVTHYQQSPMTQQAQYVILTAGFDTPVVSGTLLSHVSQLVVIDALYLGLVLADYGPTVDRMEKSAEQIARFKKY